MQEGQNASVDPVVQENDKALKEALASVVGEEAAKKFYEKESGSAPQDGQQPQQG